MTAFALPRRTTRAHLLFERNLMVYRRTWLTILSGFFEPSLAPVMSSVIIFSMLKGLVAGIAIMTLAAYYLSWSGQQDAPSEIRHRMASIDAHF